MAIFKRKKMENVKYVKMAQKDTKMAENVKMAILGHKLENGPKRPQNYHFLKKKNAPFRVIWAKTGKRAILGQ